MRSIIAGTLVALIAAFPSSGFAQSEPTARSIIETMQAKQIERWRGVPKFPAITNPETGETENVRSYVVELGIGGVGGLGVLTLYEQDGPIELGFIQIMPDDISARIEYMMGSTLTAEQKSQIAEGIIQGVRGGVNYIGKEVGLNDRNQRTLEGETRLFADAALSYFVADFDGYIEEDNAAEQLVTDMAEFAEKAELISIDIINGREAYFLLASDLNKTERTRDGTFTIVNAGMWIDTELYVPVNFRVTGRYTSLDVNDIQPFELNKYESDYREIGSLLMPFTTGMHMRFGSGTPSAETQRELDEARAQLEDFRRQIDEGTFGQQATMAPLLREMESMLKAQEAMAAGTAHGMETVVTRICLGGIETYVDMLMPENRSTRCIEDFS